MRFDRVLVIEDGCLIEDGEPHRLANVPDSRYRSFLDSEKEVRKGLWEGPEWRHLWMEDGHLSERRNS
jgi:hypothetical protein